MPAQETSIGERDLGSMLPTVSLPGTATSTSQKCQEPDTGMCISDAITMKKAKKVQHNAKCPTHTQFANNLQLSRILQHTADKLQVYFSTANPYLSKNDCNTMISMMYATAVSGEHVLDTVYPLTSEYIILVSGSCSLPYQNIHVHSLMPSIAEN